MKEVFGKECASLASFFEGSQDTMILSCLQGHMGRAWTDGGIHPRSVRMIVSCFCFFGGEPNAELVENMPAESSFVLVANPSPEWAELLVQAYPGEKHRCFQRYAIRKDTHFDEEQLKAYRNTLPAGFSLQRIGEDLYDRLMKEDWSCSFCENFLGAADYARRGIGYVVMHEGNPVSGASSFSVYDGGIEIEIDTREEYRRKGLALACASALILDCLAQGRYPSWDAANQMSVALSQKLGYVFDQEYPTYWLNTASQTDSH